jgi:hypothetical protein
MPWDGTTFKLDLSKPLNTYLTHLMADPSTNPIQLPSFEQLGRALQALAAASVVAFDPITAGSPFCPGACSSLPPALDYPGLAKSIGDLWPGNTTINTWLAARNAGTANGPTPEQIARSIEILQQKNFWDFQNPSPPGQWSPAFNLSTLAPVFHQIWTDLGFTPPPLNPNTTGGDQTPGVQATTLRAAAVQKTPEITTAAPQVTGEGTPPGASAAATPPAQGGGLTPPTGVNRLLPDWKGPKTPKTGTTPTDTGGPTGTAEPGTGPTGSQPGTPPKTGNIPSLGSIVKKFMPQKAGTTTTGTGTGTSTNASSDSSASSKAGEGK